MAELMRRARVGETFRIIVPGCDLKFVMPQGTLLNVIRHYGALGHEVICDVEVIQVPEEDTPLVIRVPKGASVEIQEEDV